MSAKDTLDLYLASDRYYIYPVSFIVEVSVKYLLSLCRLIRLTSPKLNCVFIGGAVIMYLSILFYTMPSFNPTIAEIVCEVCTVHASNIVY